MPRYHLQLRDREKQSDWYGKRGLSWHISSVVSRSQSNTTEVISYAHLFDQCTQDWYAVTLILEDLLKQLKVKNPSLQLAPCFIYIQLLYGSSAMPMNPKSFGCMWFVFVILISWQLTILELIHCLNNQKYASLLIIFKILLVYLGVRTWGKSLFYFHFKLLLIS